MKRTTLLVTVLIVTLATVGVAGYNIGHDDGYSEGFENGDSVGYQAGYNLGYERGLVDGKEGATVRSIEIEMGDVVYDQQNHRASFQIFVSVTGNLDSDENLNLVCHAPDQNNPIDWIKWDITYLDGYYNWDNWGKSSVMICQAQITSADGTVLVESEELKLQVSTSISS